MAIIGITGGTGTVGKALSRYLISRGHGVVVLCRALPSKKIQGVQYAIWNPYNGSIDAAALQDVDILIHLAGAGVAEKRWTKARKKELVASRTLSSKTLVDFLSTAPNKIKTVISMSAIGWYGPDRGKIFTEEDPAYNDFLGTTCQQWEESISPVAELAKRLVILRTGIVLTKDGGALPEFLKPLNFGMATVLGTGRQMISWIHIGDLCRMFEWAIEHENMNGVYNAVAPQPVSNQMLMHTMATQLRGKMYLTFRVPAVFLKILLGEMSIEVLKSATVSAAKIQKAGFSFSHPDIESALSSLLKIN